MTQQATITNAAREAGHTLGGTMYVDRCPKGKFSYSRHRLNSISTMPVSPGIHEVTMRCRLCGATGKTIEDYNVLRGIF